MCFVSRGPVLVGGEGCSLQAHARIQTVPDLHPARASVVRFLLFRTNISQTDVPVKAGKGNRGLPHHPGPKHRAACLSRFSLFFTARGTRVDRDRPSSKRAERCSGRWMITGERTMRRFCNRCSEKMNTLFRHRSFSHEKSHLLLFLKHCSFIDEGDAMSRHFVRNDTIL